MGKTAVTSPSKCTRSKTKRRPPRACMHGHILGYTNARLRAKTPWELHTVAFPKLLSTPRLAKADNFCTSPKREHVWRLMPLHGDRHCLQMLLCMPCVYKPRRNRINTQLLQARARREGDTLATSSKDECPPPCGAAQLRACAHSAHGQTRAIAATP